MKKAKTLLSIFLAMVFLFSLSVNATSQPMASKEDPVIRLQEIEDLRSTNSETYLMSDGSYECVVYAEDKYYVDTTCSLQLIDNSITRDKSNAYANGRSYKNAANAFDVYFSDSKTPKVDIQYREKGISFVQYTSQGEKSSLIGTTVSGMSVGEVRDCSTLTDLTSTGDNTVIYRDVFSNVDMVYVLENKLLKEYIILNNSGTPNEFSFLFTLNDVAMQTNEDATVFVAADGSTVFSLGSLFAVDANGEMTEELVYSFEPIKNTDQVIVTVVLDEDYLKDEGRAFPVVIDPSIMISSSNTADACVCSYTPNTNYQMATQLRTGFDTDYGIRRSYLKFDIPSSIPAGCVTGATLNIEKLSGAAPTMRAYRCLGSWSSGTITWNNKPSSTMVHQSTTSIQKSSGSSWYTMNVTDIVEGWVDGNHPNYGFLVMDITETNSDHWTTLYSSDAASPHKPELIINYSQYYYGPRPYQSTSREDINCMGYALEYSDYITGEMLGMSVTEMAGKTLVQLEAYTKSKAAAWMNSKFGSSNWAYINTYDSAINTNWYRVVLRVGFIDADRDGVFDQWERFDYHWWYQTSTGDWADKLADEPSRYRSGTVGLNPVSFEWIEENWVSYNSGGVFYQIRDIRNVAWS